MRWRYCSALLIAAALGACATTKKTFYLPPAGADRITEEELHEHANEVLHIECPRLLSDRISVSGEADLTLDVAEEGAVSRVRLDDSSGDARLDDILGGLAATLQLEPAARARRRESVRLSIGYACTPGAVAASVTRGR
jgi:hypothetical protein